MWRTPSIMTRSPWEGSRSSRMRRQPSTWNGVRSDLSIPGTLRKKKPILLARSGGRSRVSISPCPLRIQPRTRPPSPSGPIRRVSRWSSPRSGRRRTACSSRPGSPAPPFPIPRLRSLREGRCPRRMICGTPGRE